MMYENIKTTILAPCQSTRRAPSRCYKPCWNIILDQLAKERSKLYCNALTINHERDKEKYRRMDRLIKNVTKIYKGKRQMAYIKRLAQAKPNELGRL